SLQHPEFSRPSEYGHKYNRPVLPITFGASVGVADRKRNDGTPFETPGPGLFYQLLTLA
ncbi:hypothetical protein LCGC14_1846800, partial [marine sediment metagenome]